MFKFDDISAKVIVDVPSKCVIVCAGTSGISKDKRLPFSFSIEPVDNPLCVITFKFNAS